MRKLDNIDDAVALARQAEKICVRPTTVCQISEMQPTRENTRSEVNPVCFMSRTQALMKPIISKPNIYNRENNGRAENGNGYQTNINRNQNFNTTCTFCGMNGHVESKCRKKLAQYGIKCNYCGILGHVEQDCQKKRKQSNNSCGYCGMMGHHENNCHTKDMECFTCHNKGHVSRNCPRMANRWTPKQAAPAEFSNNDKQQVNFLIQENEELKRKYMELSQAAFPRSQINMINEEKVNSESTNPETQRNTSEEEWVRYQENEIEKQQQRLHARGVNFNGQFINMIQSQQVEDGGSEILGSLFNDEPPKNQNGNNNQGIKEKLNDLQNVDGSVGSENSKTKLEAEDKITEAQLRQIIDDISHSNTLLPFENLCGLMNHVRAIKKMLRENDTLVEYRRLVRKHQIYLNKNCMYSDFRIVLQFPDKSTYKIEDTRLLRGIKIFVLIQQKLNQINLNIEFEVYDGRVKLDKTKTLDRKSVV